MMEPDNPRRTSRRLRILVVADVLSEPEIFAGRRRVEGLAGAWAAAGHEVHVLTPGPVVPLPVPGCEYHVTSPVPRRLATAFPALYWTGRRAVRRVRRAYAFPDPGAAWYRPATRAGARVLASAGPFDLIFSSFSSATSHRVAARLAEESGVPWIADYRDLWTDEVYHDGEVPLYLFQGRQPPRRDWERHREMERRALQHAAAITTISEPMAEVLRRKVRGRVPVLVVPNGFADERIAPDGAARGGSFTIAYTGKLNVGPGAPELRMFFEALARLEAEAPGAGEHVRVEFFGSRPEDIRRLAVVTGVEGLVHVHPPCDLRRSVEVQRSAALLLLFLPLQGRRSVGVSSRKLFDYLAARRPILGIVPRVSHAAEIIEETAAGWVATSEEEIREALLTAWQAYVERGMVPCAAREEAVLRYSFSRLAERVLEPITTAAGNAAPDAPDADLQRSHG